MATTMCQKLSKCIITRAVQSRLSRSVPKVNYAAAKKIAKTGMQIAPKARLEVESDVNKLVSHCCGANIYIEGEDPVLKSDEEYPDWLWTLRLDRTPQDLSELDPDTSKYWQRAKKLTMRRNNAIMKTTKLK